MATKGTAVVPDDVLRLELLDSRAVAVADWLQGAISTTRHVSPDTVALKSAPNGPLKRHLSWPRLSRPWSALTPMAALDFVKVSGSVFTSQFQFCACVCRLASLLMLCPDYPVDTTLDLTAFAGLIGYINTSTGSLALEHSGNEPEGYKESLSRVFICTSTSRYLLAYSCVFVQQNPDQLAEGQTYSGCNTTSTLE